jgi:hypothetical protein
MSEKNEDTEAGSPHYHYLGNFASCERWAERSMHCDACRVEWTGCWDNFMCPECGEGQLPGFEPLSMTLRKPYEESSDE